MEFEQNDFAEKHRTSNDYRPWLRNAPKIQTPEVPLIRRVECSTCPAEFSVTKEYIVFLYSYIVFYDIFLFSKNSKI